ncbi:MATE family efflux transporter [Gilvimarinus xylanilyticus]|uniref:MATE family efflux transporter n=1 Tax=Gilvimarinus xylanilyticus TaxID=2944139 RepID=A0A9X2HZA5_9GAMM|nr:MATE family efflux transporter [Gilvimarinus xylanilyticus]MCP8899844.1 MATE family efflux transporter [Gilvimarinus xylanilyticus]
MPQAKRDLFLHGSIPRALLTLSVPIILANILQAGYQLTDTYWVGRLGADAVAAVSVSTPVTFLVVALGSGLGMAGTTLTAQYIGAGRADKVNQVAAQTLLLVVVISAFLGALGFIFAPQFLALIGVSAEVYTGALAYMRTSFVGVAFVFAFFMMQSLMRGVGQTRIPLIIIAVTVVLNMGLDPLLIFGVGPLPGLGVMGAALATLMTQGLAAALGLWVFWRGQHGIHLHRALFKPDFSYIKKACALGLPGSIELSTRSLGVMIMSFLAASFGTLAIASYGIGANILQVITIPALGLSMSVSTLVGQNMGAGFTQRAEHIARLGAIYGFVALTLIGALTFWQASALVAFFVPDDAAVIAEGATFIRIMALAWGGIGVQLCVVAAFRASGNMLNAMVLALVSQWLVQFPIAYVLSKHTDLGIAGVWWSFPVTNVLVALVAFAWFSHGGWKRTRITDEDVQVQTVVDNALKDEGGLPRY